MTITIRGDFDHLVAHQKLEKLKQCFNVTEKYLGQAKAEFEAKSYEELGLDLFLKNERDEIYSEELWYYAVKFPRILRNSFLVTAISLLEYEMGRICGRLKRKEPMQSSWTDSKGNFFEKFKKCCKEAKLDLSFTDRTWHEINNYYKVRNCIVHTNGLVMELEDKDRKALVPYLRKMGIISEDTIDEEIALTASFCKELIKTMQYFLNDVYEAISIARKKLKSDNTR